MLFSTSTLPSLLVLSTVLLGFASAAPQDRNGRREGRRNRFQSRDDDDDDNDGRNALARARLPASTYSSFLLPSSRLTSSTRLSPTPPQPV